MSRTLRVLELYAGIGGLAAALGRSAEVVAAVDINAAALEVYGHNFPHRRTTALVESLDISDLASLEADLWWASPPCQPFTRRGRRLDLEDPRAKTFIALVDRIVHVRPRYAAIENVVGFEASSARDLLRRRLDGAGYRQVHERLLCPSELGWPNRRPRYYLLASLEGDLGEPASSPLPRTPLAPLLESEASADLVLDPEVYRRYRHAVHVVGVADPEALTGCFTSAYGRSPVRSGSYLAGAAGPRHFSPEEVLRLLGYPLDYRFPPWAKETLKGRKKAWRLAGNSLSLPAVRHALSCIPGLQQCGGSRGGS